MAEKFGYPNLPLQAGNTQLTALHTGFNVTLFVMETTPAPLPPSIESLLFYMNNTWLQENAAIFTNHHSTHAESDLLQLFHYFRQIPAAAEDTKVEV